VPVGTVAELAGWCLGEAGPLADAFDLRNGTSAAREELTRSWSLRAEPHRVELSVLVPTPVPTTASTAASISPSAPQEGPRSEGSAPGPEQDPTVEAERLARAGDLAAAAAAYRRAAQVALAAGRLADAGFAHAESARCAQRVHDHEGAHRAYAHAGELLRAGGVAPTFRGRVVRAWAPSAVEVGEGGQVLAELERLTAELAEAVPTDTPAVEDDLGRRAQAARHRELLDVADTTARTLAALDRVEEAARRAGAAAEAYAGIGAVGDAAHAFWLAGRLLGRTGAVDEAVWHLESAVEGFGMARDRSQQSRAAGDLIELLREHGRAGQADEVARGLLS
ncbi:MAG: hypothetical protein HGA44_20000, partial [Cellulomonadaceae bacterium]|nr:hypothetical protein [Cellulomonadaceae bacterium]